MTLQTYAQDELISLTKGYGTAQQATWVFNYDPASLGLISTVDPNQHISSATWDASGNQFSRTDALGRITTYTYDTMNDLTSITDPAGVTAYLSYDSHGNLIGASHPLASYLPGASATPTAIPTASPSPVALSDYTIPTGNSQPYGIAAGPDGNLWFTEFGANKIGVAAPSGAVQHEFALASGSNPYVIVAGPDGNLWFTEHGAGKIGRISPTGTITEYGLAAGSSPVGIAAGPDGNLWFTEYAVSKIGRITTGGTITEYALAPRSGPDGISVGPDGNLWFAEFNANKIGRITTGGAIAEFALAAGSGPAAIAAGPDGNLWLSEYGTNKVGHIAANGTLLGEVALSAGSLPVNIIVAPDGNLWLAESGADRVARVTTGGTVTEFSPPTRNGSVDSIGIGPDGAPWFSEGSANRLGRIALTAVTTVAYDPAHAGDLTAITDPNGHTWRYGYDAATGNLTSIADPLNDTTTLGYDTIGRVTSIVSPDGNAPSATPTRYTTTLSYNAFGDVASLTDPLLTGQATPGVTRYSYDSNRNLVSLRDANGYTTTYGYDADNERTGVTQPTPTGTPTATAVSDSTSYDGAGNVASHTDFNGHTVSYGYDPLDRLTSVSQPVTQPSPVGTQTRVTSFVYDGVGNRTQMTDPLGHVSTYGYDAADQATGANWLDAQGTPVASVYASYDADGNVLSRTDADGHTTQYRYDSLGRQIAVTDPLGRTTVAALDPAGNTLLETDPGLRSTAYGYDAANRQIGTTFADASAEGGQYDAEGNLVHYTDANSHATQYAYDALDRLTQITDARGKLTSYGYDAVGNRTSVRLPLNPATAYGYDQLNRPVSAQDPINPATIYGYDPMGNLTGVLDPLGHSTHYSYDDANERVQTTQPDASVLTTAYDADGNVTATTDANHHTTSYVYDVLNHESSATDPLSRVTRYVYDPVGNLKSLIDATQPTGRVTSYGYDAADEPTGITYSDGVTPNVTWTYTASGQRATMQDGTGTTVYSYDSRDRLTRTVNGAGLAVGYGYDAVGNLTATSYPSGLGTVTRSYDALNRLQGVTDWFGRTSTFGYDDNSNLTSIAYPTTNSLTAAYSYDAANGLKQIVDSRLVGGTQAPFWTFNYTLDHLEQVGAASDPVQSGSVQHTYSRNVLDQLTADARSGSQTGTVGWAYDSAYRTTGRTDSAAGTGSTYSADAAAELTALVTTSSGSTTRNLTLSYNAEGDRTSQHDSVANTTATYTYDQADRLTGYSGGSVSGTYAYNGDGLRMARTAGGATSREAWDESGGLPMLLTDGGTAFIAGPGGLPVEQYTGGSARSLLTDRLGSVVGLADSTGTLTDSYGYDPYGQRTTATGSAADSPLGYAGQYTDPESGLTYLRARYYDPASGQFLTRDPLAMMGGHPYAYAEDNPLNATDPSGLCPWGVPDRLCDAASAASGAVSGAFQAARNAVGGAANAALKRALQAGIQGLNEALAIAAQSDFASGVNDAVLDFALSVQNLPGSVQPLLANYRAHPEQGARDAIDFYTGTLFQQLSLLPPVAMLQAVRTLAGLVGQVRAAVDCRGLGYSLGYSLTGSVLKFALAHATAGLARAGAEWLGQGLSAEGGSPCGLCFPAGTLVATPRGAVPIERLKVGDAVLAEDSGSGKVEARRVAATIAHPASELARVSFADGGAVQVTADHPFWVDASGVRARAGWVAASDLRPGERLRTASGRDATVAGVSYNVGRAPVYTLTVAVDHDFFVGAARVLVHNSASCPSVRLAKAMAQERNIQRPHKGWAAHHIVPDKGGGIWGAMARALVEEWGIPINDAFNGVYLPGISTSKYHFYKPPGIHTDTYFEAVYDLLRLAKEAGATADEARAVLATIGEDLSSANFPY